MTDFEDVMNTLPDYTSELFGGNHSDLGDDEFWGGVGYLHIFGNNSKIFNIPLAEFSHIRNVSELLNFSNNREELEGEEWFMMGFIPESITRSVEVITHAYHKYLPSYYMYQTSFEWLRNGQPHREKLPARITLDYPTRKIFYLQWGENSKPHRMDGPYCMKVDPHTGELYKNYAVNGIEMSEEDYETWTNWYNSSPENSCVPIEWGLLTLGLIR